MTPLLKSCLDFTLKTYRLGFKYLEVDNNLGVNTLKARENPFQNLQRTIAAVAVISSAALPTVSNAQETTRYQTLIRGEAGRIEMNMLRITTAGINMTYQIDAYHRIGQPNDCKITVYQVRQESPGSKLEERIPINAEFMKQAVLWKAEGDRATFSELCRELKAGEDKLASSTR